MTTSWRPTNWAKMYPGQCDFCPSKIVDDYGWRCDITCGKHTQHVCFEKGAEAIVNSEEVKRALAFWHLMKDPFPGWAKDIEKYYEE